MKYFVKLNLGVQYFVAGKTFLRGEEQEVDEKLAKYLETVAEQSVVAEGNGHVVKKIPKFIVRTEELTTKEKVEKEIEDAPDSLKPNKPGRKPAA